MTLNTVRGGSDKPAIGRILNDLLSQLDALNGTLYFGYPILGNSVDPLPVDAVLLTRQTGLVVFCLVEGGLSPDYVDVEDEVYAQVLSKLLSHAGLRSGRSLSFELNVMTFASASGFAEEVEGRTVYTPSSLTDRLDNCQEIGEDLFKRITASMQGVLGLKRGQSQPRKEGGGPRDAILRKLEDRIATLDSDQEKAAIELVDGVQRIRGLAGSGKTVVLALKAALMHTRHPTWRIGVTFHTQSLKQQFRQLISRFSREQCGREPDWERLQVLNSWGAPGSVDRTGVYHEFCMKHGLSYLNYTEASHEAGGGNAFDFACKQALSAVTSKVGSFDMLLVDEAQDLPPSFLRLCFEFLDESKRLVYAYDELQNLKGESLPPASEIFGNDDEGRPRVSLGADNTRAGTSDFVLPVCYRNSRPVLVAAHALGFGVYRPQGLAQMFEQRSLWADVGYRVISGDLNFGENVRLERTERSSPLFLEEHSDFDDLIAFKSVVDGSAQREWLVDDIVRMIKDEGLRAEDILVVNPNPMSTRRAVGPVREALRERQVNSILAGVSTRVDEFRVPGAVTFSGIYRAKGNEAALVYVMNAQDCVEKPTARQLAQSRNQLFAAMTRSKAWLRVIGVGEVMDKLCAEFQAVKGNDFSLDFVYPTERELEEIALVNRDMSPSELAEAENTTMYMNRIIASFGDGLVKPVDIPEEVRDQMRRFLSSRDGSDV